jgi:alpha-amylase/alpha-mannosidase (GH57 family)
MKLVLCWHMHQPYYRDELHGDYRLPWVYLHAMKDYTDMAWHLERHPKMRLVVNFAPVLLEQLLDYAAQISAYLNTGTPVGDRMLGLLAGTVPIPTDPQERHLLIKDCMRCNADTMIKPWPAYKALTDIPAHILGNGDGNAVNKGKLRYLDEQYFYDLLTWYHLSWLGHSVKQQDEITLLIEKGSNYSHEDRTALLRVIHACVAGIIPRYRKLAERGQIELSMSPWGHPIVPLLHDFENVKYVLPDAPQPSYDIYPGGLQRSRWHMQQGLDLFEQCFGHRPGGIWLSEGSISQDAMELLDEYHMQWTASGENVWRNSARLSKLDEEDISSKRGLFQVYSHTTEGCRIFFRDDGLSDLIGFEYRDWASGDAVANFVMHLKNIGKFLAHNNDNHVISVIMDGENAWEYYPDNGCHFIDQLYRELVNEPSVEVLTFSEATALPAVDLPVICAGSWVYGTFSTWIGDAEKNRAWDLLIEEKRNYDRVMTRTDIDERQRDIITRQLGICEGSDWFWWFGDYNPSESVQDFDELYRSQLRMLYQLMDLTPPPSLEIPISHGSDRQRGGSGTMRRNA